MYFFDTGLVRGDQGVVLENAVAGMLLKLVHFLQDNFGKTAGLHYIRTKDGTEVGFALSEEGRLIQMIECKLSDNKPHRGLSLLGELFPEAEAIQIVYGLRQEEFGKNIRITDAGTWLLGLSA